MFESSKWIWNRKNAEADEYADFRAVFPASHGRCYRIALSCDSDYNLYCNGRLAAFGQYADYPDYKIYDAVCLDDFIADGENELLITVWYYGADSQTYIKKEAGLLFQLDEDGKTILFSSENTASRLNPHYVQHSCVNITSQLGFTFAYNAAASAEEFAPSRTVDGCPRVLYPRPIRKTLLCGRAASSLCFGGGFVMPDKSLGAAERMQSAYLSFGHAEDEREGSFSLTAGEGDDGVYLIVDLGAENVGFLDFDIEVSEECDIDIGWGEHLADGRCRTAIRNFSCRYHASAGRNAYMNAFRRMGCRYIQLFAAAKHIKIYYLGLRPVLYPLTEKECDFGNPLRNRIYEVCLQTLRLCMHEHYEDCPWREQALYTMDSRNQMLCGYYAFGEYRFPRACLELISHGVRKDGLLSLCFPAGLDFPIPAFSLLYFIQMREYLDHAGDIGFIRSKYPMLKELIGVFLDRLRENGLIDSFSGEGGYWNFYEWSEGMEGRFNEQVSSVEAPFNAFLSLALQNFACISDKLGFASEAEEYRFRADSINKAIAKEFYESDVGLFASFSDRGKGRYHVLTNGLCLLCGAAEGCEKSVIFKILEANGGGGTGLSVIPDTLSMRCFRFDALLRYDREKYRSVILSEIDKTYFDMLRKDATSFWETSEGESAFGGAGSLCHGWSALPIYYYHTLI